jgi:hypothetical protein
MSRDGEGRCAREEGRRREKRKEELWSGRRRRRGIGRVKSKEDVEK